MSIKEDVGTNLFWWTRHRIEEREDHLTEFFVAALRACPSFRAEYYRLVIAPFAQAQGWTASSIATIETQRSFAGTDCCVDVLFHLTDGKRIVCEHKLDAAETPGPECNPMPQLERYLALPVDGVIYVRSSYKPPNEQVMSHPKYVHPSDRSHFIWRDFYSMLSAEEHILLTWLRDGFDLLDFAPPHPTVGEMSGSDKAVNQANRQNFAKMWSRARNHAASLGWIVTTGSIVELYMSGNPSSIASSIFISPAKADRFLFRVTPHNATLELAKAALKQAADSLPMRTELDIYDLRRTGGMEAVIDVATSLHEILGAAPLCTEEIETRLMAFTSPLLDSLQIG